MERKSPSGWEVTCAVGVAGDRVYLACCPDSTDPEEHPEYTRLQYYHAQSSPPWTKHDVQFWTVRLARFRAGEDAPWTLCSLSEQGDVELVSGRVASRERIPEAGLDEPGRTSIAYGYVSAIRQIGTHLYVCGDGGQVYRRLGTNCWEHIDRGLLRNPSVDLTAFDDIRSWDDLRNIASFRLPGIDNQLDLQAIDGPSEDDIYVAGSAVGPSGFAAFLSHWNGLGWSQIDLPPVRSVNAIHVDTRHRIFLAGQGGALLVGDHRSGFKTLPGAGRRHLFHDVCRYEGTLYLGSAEGLLRYDDTKARVVPVDTGLSRELGYIHTVDAIDGVLWCIGPRDIARLSGTTWSRVDFPEG